MLVCGVDSSTQSTKVELRDIGSGELVAAGAAPHPTTSPPRSEQHPADWWQALEAALGQVGPWLEDVGAISVAGQQHGLVVLDHQGQVLRPAKLWNDTESASAAASLVAQLGAEAWAQRCGSVPVAAFTITKLAWLAHAEPETFAAVRKVMLPHDWLTFTLSGRHVTDRGDGSGSGWWSPATGAVDIGLLELVDAERDWSGVVPEVLDPFVAVGPITAEAAARTGLPVDCLVAAGTGDNMGAALGLGLRPGDVVVSLGTSGTVYAVSAHPTADPRGFVAGFADASGAFLPLVCTLNATGVTDVFQRLLGMERDEFTAAALDSPAGANGLVLVPYMDGERTPNMPAASATLSGIRRDVTRADIARASHEGVV
ncbi:MAG: xylulokinase, partial [Acidimicrobiales bacterium]